MYMKTGKALIRVRWGLCIWTEERAGKSSPLNVDQDSNQIDFGLALSVAGMYEMPEKQAKETVDRIQDTVERNWRKLAREYGLSRGEAERLAPAFDMAYKR